MEAEFRQQENELKRKQRDKIIFCPKLFIKCLGFLKNIFLPPWGEIHEQRTINRRGENSTQYPGSWGVAPQVFFYLKYFKKDFLVKFCYKHWNSPVLQTIPSSVQNRGHRHGVGSWIAPMSQWETASYLVTQLVVLPCCSVLIAQLWENQTCPPPPYKVVGSFLEPAWTWKQSASSLHTLFSRRMVICFGTLPQQI